MDDICQYDDWSQESMIFDNWHHDSLWQDNWTYNSANRQCHRSCQRPEYVSNKRRTDAAF
uniref:Uncharacterized protein n=1 Tax=Ascaris lumbricoides TaxID=6252 RepID=A0A0M3IIP1_ASCLU